MRMNIQIKNLKDYPEFAQTVAGWIYHEFAEGKDDIDFEHVLSRFKNRNRDTVPLSLIAISNNQCVGAVSIFENDLKTRPTLTPWLAGLFVPESYRGRGIAEMLINAVVNKCREMGHRKVYLRTEHTAEYYKNRGWTWLEDTKDELGQETSVFYKII